MTLFNFTVLVFLCALMLVVWGCAAALPILERVGLVTGGFVVLGGEGGADLPGKRDSGYHLDQSSGALHSTVSTHAILC